MLFLFLFAIFTGSGSLIYTRFLVEILKNEERKKVELWAEATRLITLADNGQDIEFLSSIIENNITIPVILTDEADSIISSGNFDVKKLRDPEYLNSQVRKIKKKNGPIVIDLGKGHFNQIYYKDSIILTRLNYYPYIQTGIIILFILVAFLAFSSSRKAENNQVWVSMSKEIARDVERLEKITERFSRIGSRVALKDENLAAIISGTIGYLKTRTSSKVSFVFDFDTSLAVIIPLNAALFEWAVENISKNAIDAMEGSGIITYRIVETDNYVQVDISDTGKGIPKGAFKKIFSPGYTTKQRGWGLGLSLTKRIVEEFHRGKIYVKHSEPGIGSSIRIILNK